MSLNKRLLILKKRKTRLFKDDPILQWFKRNWKMQVQWNVQKKGGFPHSQSFYVCMERMQSRIST